MVHQVVTELTGAAAESTGPDIGCRAKQKPGSVDRRCAKEDHLGLVIDGLIGIRIDRANAGGSFGIGIVENLAHDLVWQERQSSRFCRVGKGRRLCAEVGAVGTSEPTRVAILTLPAAVVR